MHRSVPYILAVTVGTLAALAAAAADNADKEHAELAKALAAAKVSLEGGLSAAGATGKPISAKFEVEGGRLQLSIYTEKDGKFSEVAVDYVSGKVAKSEPITAGEDLSAAKSQSGAMAKANLPLSAAVAKAASANPRTHPRTAFPSLQDGRPPPAASPHH